LENCVDFIAWPIECHTAKIVVKVLKYTRTASAKLKVFWKISTKSGKNSTILFQSRQYTNSRCSL